MCVYCVMVWCGVYIYDVFHFLTELAYICVLCRGVVCVVMATMLA